MSKVKEQKVVCLVGSDLREINGDLSSGWQVASGLGDSNGCPYILLERDKPVNKPKHPIYPKSKQKGARGGG